MTLNDPKLWLDLAQWVTTLAIGLYVWMAGRHRATREQIEELQKVADKRLDGHETRLTKLEERNLHTPSAADFKELSDRLHQFRADLREVSTEVKNWRELNGMVRHQIELMDEYLRRQKL